MEAGRELDALIAEKVMGWHMIEVPWKIGGKGMSDLWYDEKDIVVQPPPTHFQVGLTNVPMFSIEFNAAWLVVQALEKRGFWCEMRTPFSEPFGRDGYWAGFTPHGTSGWNGCPDHWTDAATLPLAICLAALKAIEP